MDSIEIIGGHREENEFDIDGQIKALESQKETLEEQYDESNNARIEALKREIERLKSIKTEQERAGE